ncbi:MAG: hypothetical protein AABX00_01820 [Nanoarchaeota archaeon]
MRVRRFIKNVRSLNKKPRNIDTPIIWWKDINLFIGIFLILASLVIGFYGKGLIGIFFSDLLSKLYSPFYLFTGLSVYGASWIVMFIGISIVGWETARIIQYKIRHKVKKTVKKTYKHAKNIHKKSGDYAKRLHNSNIDKIAKMSKKEYDSINIK